MCNMKNMYLHVKIQYLVLSRLDDFWIFWIFVAWRMQLFWYLSDGYNVCLLNHMLCDKEVHVNFQLIYQTTISKFHEINCNDHCNRAVILKCSWCKKICTLHIFFFWKLSLFIANLHGIFLLAISAIELKNCKKTYLDLL